MNTGKFCCLNDIFNWSVRVSISDIITNGAAENKAILGEDAPCVKSSLFIHIPITAVKDAYLEYTDAGRSDTENVKYVGGHDGEAEPFVFCPAERDGVFERLLDGGSCDSAFYGHDHLNNFVFEYNGITLAYGFSVDYSGYSDIDKVGYQRGCTVITYSDDAFEISHENYYQDKYVPLYEKESVDMTK